MNLEQQSHGAYVQPGVLSALIRKHRIFSGETAARGGTKASKRWGFGLEFAEIRNYVPGDEVRHINWRASTRTQKLMTKVYTEDQDARVLLLVDLMQHMYYGTSKRLCSVMAVYLSAMLAGLLLARSYQIAIGWMTSHRLHIARPGTNQAQLLGRVQLLGKSHNQELEKAHQQQAENEIYKHIRPRLFAPYSRIVLLTTPYGDIPHHKTGKSQALRRIDVYDPRLVGNAGGFHTLSNRARTMPANHLAAVPMSEDSIASDCTLTKSLAILRQRFGRF